MKKRLISLLLTVVILLSLVVVPANAALVSGTGTLTITPNVTLVKGSTSAPAEVIYTIKVTPPTEGPVGEFHFNLKAPDGMTLSEVKLKPQAGNKGGDGYWLNMNDLWYNPVTEEGIFETFEYTPTSKYFQAAGTNASRNMTTEAEIMTIKATIAAGKVGDFTLTAENVGINKDGTDSYSFNVKTTPVTVVSELTGNLPVDITAPVKGATPQSTISATTQYTGTIAWEGNPTTFAANTAYTATVTLTAKPGYQFANGVNPTVAGSTSVTGVNVKDSGSKLEFKATFPRTADKDTPVITTLPTAGSINYDQMLYESSLSGGEAKVGSTVVPGSFKWKEELLKPEVKDSNATEYEVVFKPNDTTSYETTTCKVKLTVNKKTLTNLATTPISDQLYTGSPITPTFNVMNGKNFDEILDPSDYKVIFKNNTNVGTANYTIKETPTGNYKFNTSYGTFEIKKADSTISIIGDPSKTYDGKVVNDPAVNKSGSTGAVTYTYYTNEDCTTKTTAANSGAASDGAAPKNAGDYWVVAAVAASANYNAATSAAKKFTISQKDLTDDMITLGTQKTYNGTEQSVQIASVKDGTASLIAGGHDYSIVSGNKATDVGDNTLVIKGKGNYKGTAHATWSLVAKDVTITPDAKSKTYGEADPTLTYTTDIDGDATLKGKFDTAKSGALSRDTGEDVGTYAIGIGTLAAGNNFKLKLAAATVNFTINKATPVITATTPRQLVNNGVEVDISDWASFTNTDSGATLTYTLDTAPAGITLVGNKLKAASSVAAGATFEIKVNAYGTHNFTAPTEFTIHVTVVNKEDAGVSITTPPTSKTYGDANFSLAATKTAPNGGTWSWNSSNPAILDIVSGADTATPTIKVKKADTAGATLTVTYTSDTHYGSASAAITVAPKTLTAADLTHSGPITKVYDTNTNAPTGLTVSVKSGSLVGTDTLAVTGTLKYNSANVNEANKITFTPDAITTGNYALAASEVLTITGAKITQATPTYTVPTGLTAKYGQTLADVNIAATTGWSWMNTGTAVGTPATKNFPAKFTPTDAINYKTVENIDVSVAVSKADAPTLTNITVSQKYTVDTEQSKNIGTAGMPADAGTLTYTKGTASKTGSVTVTSWAVDATGKVTYTLSGGAAGNTVTLPVTIGSNNYADATVNVVITIIKATPTGEPAYTKITTSGKTLADAALGVGTIKPNAGTLVWVDDAENVLPGDTEVKANTNYKWRFTPTDTNYESISGTIKLWSKSSGGSGSYYPAGITFTTDLPVGTINRVAVNGKTLDSKNYVVNGSDVTLLQSYLATLKAGKYTVKIENKTHVSTGTFTIKADGTLSSPKTADAGVCLYAAMALMSGTGAAYVTLRRKKEN